MPPDIYIAAGIIGAILVLIGFYRVSIGQWTGKSLWYEIDNLAGALLVTIYQLHYHAYVSMVVNVIWGIVAFRGIISYRERRPK